MANKSISQLNAGAAVAAGNLVPVVQTVGIGPVKITASAFGDYFLKGTYTSNTLVYDSVNNNIGIGTTTPTNISGATTLSINATGANQSGVVVFQNSGSQLARQGILSGFFTIQDLGSANGLVIDEQSALPVIFKTTALERMRITSSGNVGIGTTSPASRLDVSASNYVDPVLTISQSPITTGNKGVINFNDSTGTTGAIYSYGSAFGAGNNYALTFLTNTGSSLTEKMRITSAGNVGIGTTSPATKLAVANSNINVTDLYGLSFGSAQSTYLYGSSAAGTLKLATNSQDRLTVDASGNVGIGTTSPNAKLDVANGAIFVGSSANTSQTNTLLNGYGYNIGATLYGNTSIRSTYSNADNSASLEFYVASGGTSTNERMRISSAGNVGIGSTNPTQALFIERAGALALQLTNTANSLNLLLGTNTTEAYVSAPNGALAFLAAGSERMRITGAGNVGIGTTTISAYGSLTTNSDIFVGPSGNAGYLRVASNSNQALFSANQYYNGAVKATVTGYSPSIEMFISDGTIRFNRTTSASANANISSSESMRITTEGNVGIGTATLGTSAAAVLGIATGTAPTTGPADTIQIYSSDLSAGNTMLSVYTEGTSVGTGTPTADRTIAVRINGTVYYLLASTIP